MDNEKKCKKCNSENINALSQYSDENGKIITKWVCLDCGKHFKTKW